MKRNLSIKFMIYETTLKKPKKRHDLSKKDNKGVTTLKIVLLKVLAKLKAITITYLLLIVKSRL